MWFGFYTVIDNESRPVIKCAVIFSSAPWSSSSSASSSSFIVVFCPKINFQLLFSVFFPSSVSLTLYYSLNHHDYGRLSSWWTVFPSTCIAVQLCFFNDRTHTHTHIYILISSNLLQPNHQVYANFGQYNGFGSSPGEPANFNAFSKYILMDTGLIGFLNHKFYSKCLTQNLFSPVPLRSIAFFSL